MGLEQIMDFVIIQDFDPGPCPGGEPRRSDYNAKNAIKKVGLVAET